jgi:hypothetical protein
MTHFFRLSLGTLSLCQKMLEEKFQEIDEEGKIALSSCFLIGSMLFL